VILFADSGFFIGLYHETDQFHDDAKRIWTRLKKDGKIEGLQSLVVTDYILVEVFHSLQERIGFHKTAKIFENLVKKCQIERVTFELMDVAIQTKMIPFCNHRTHNPSIGLVDATSLIMMDLRGISHIVSFDGGFDTIPLTKRIYNVSTIPD
jgi:predicted nucleic acid-binding protein